MTPPLKKVGIIIRQPPYGSLLSQEALDVCLAAGMFGQQVSLFFLGDGVFHLAEGQNSKAIGQKNRAKQLAALELYDIEHIHACQASLEERQLILDQKILQNIAPLDNAALSALIHEQEVLLSF